MRRPHRPSRTRRPRRNPPTPTRRPSRRGRPPWWRRVGAAPSASCARRWPRRQCRLPATRSATRRATRARSQSKPVALCDCSAGTEPSSGSHGRPSIRVVMATSDLSGAYPALRGSRNCPRRRRSAMSRTAASSNFQAAEPPTSSTPGLRTTPTYVLLHSVACTGLMTWYPALEEVRKFGRVVVFDQRCHGQGITTRRGFSSKIVPTMSQRWQKHWESPHRSRRVLDGVIGRRIGVEAPSRACRRIRCCVRPPQPSVAPSYRATGHRGLRRADRGGQPAGASIRTRAANDARIPA